MKKQQLFVKGPCGEPADEVYPPPTTVPQVWLRILKSVKRKF